MNIYVLIEELEQDEFTDRNGESAYPVCNLVGVYEDREKAEKEKEHYEAASKEDAKKYGCDPYSYYIEERPLL